jgi:uncharacterized protein YcsI (UPF0317 family)
VEQLLVLNKNIASGHLQANMVIIHQHSADDLFEINDAFHQQWIVNLMDLGQVDQFVKHLEKILV